MDRVIPGEIVGKIGKNQLGRGVYQRGNDIIASIKGTIERNGDTLSVVATTTPNLPKVDSIVVAKVIRINPRYATVEIMVVDEKPISAPFQGIIQQKDVRQTSIDSVEISKSFRPGDVVKAKVVGLGEQKSFILSTASNDLGVVLAQSINGHTMIPISWEEMICPVTRSVEFRKCAKPTQ